MLSHLPIDLFGNRNRGHVSRAIFPDTRFSHIPTPRTTVDPVPNVYYWAAQLGWRGSALCAGARASNGVKGLSGFVHVVDDDAAFRKAMERRLKQAGYDVATYPSALDLLVNLPPKASRAASCSTCEFPAWMARHCRSVWANSAQHCRSYSSLAIHDIPATVQAIKAGADDFLTKPVASDDLFRAIEKAFANHQTLRDLKDKLESGRARLGRLTPREREVFELVIGGEPNKQIARAIGCTTRTVKAHRHQVMEKMQVKSLAELVSLAERIGIRA